MPVEWHAGDVIRLHGDCGVEDAEAMLSLLLGNPGATVEWAACTKAHTAVAQVLVALAPPLAEGGPCGDPVLERWIAPILRRHRTSA